MSHPIPLSHADFRDRSTGLIVFGVIAILIGALCGCGGLATPLVLVMPTANASGVSEPDPRAIVVAAMLYLALAALFVTLGIGSIRARRWVRPIMLSVAWTWLIFGIVAGLVWAWTAPNMPDMLASMNPAQPIPRSFGVFVTIASGAFMLVTQIAMPIAFILFYRSRHVQATLADRDPRPSWTDRCPVQVLGLSIGLLAGGAGLLMFLPYAVAPAFGVLARGPAAVALIAAAVALCIFLAWATYRVKPVGWWGTLLLFILLPAASVPTFARVPPADFYAAMGIAPEQLVLYRSLSGTVVNLLTLALTLAGVVYLFRLRHYFRTT